MPTQEEITSSLNGLEKPDYDVHVIDDAWYSSRALARAIGNPEFDKFPAVSVVRIGLKQGILELHPVGDMIQIKCYCCFGVPDCDKGTFPLDQLRDAVVALKDHYCPPWPG